MRHETKDDVVTIWLEGRIDTNNAPQIEQEIEGILAENDGAKPAIDQAKEGLFKMIDMLHPIPITKA